MKYIIPFFIFLTIIFSSCCTEKTIEKPQPYSTNSSDCISLSQEIQFLLQKFKPNKNLNNLKKANILIDSALNNCDDKASFLQFKFEYFLNIQDYQNGLIYFQNIDTTIYPDSYLNNFYLNSFKIKKLDSINSIQIYKDMHITIEEYLNRMYFDHMDLSSSFINRFKLFPNNYCAQNINAVLRYFIIRAKIFGIEDVKKYLNEIKATGSSVDIESWNTFYFPVLISHVQDVNNSDYIIY
jgi:hypothetical protein